MAPFPVVEHEVANWRYHLTWHSQPPVVKMPGPREFFRQRRLSKAFYILPPDDEDVKEKVENLLKNVDDDTPLTSLQVSGLLMFNHFAVKIKQAHQSFFVLAPRPPSRDLCPSGEEEYYSEGHERNVSRQECYSSLSDRSDGPGYYSEGNVARQGRGYSPEQGRRCVSKQEQYRRSGRDYSYSDGSSDRSGERLVRRRPQRKEYRSEEQLGRKRREHWSEEHLHGSREHRSEEKLGQSNRDYQSEEQLGRRKDHRSEERLSKRNTEQGSEPYLGRRREHQSEEKLSKRRLDKTVSIKEFGRTRRRRSHHSDPHLDRQRRRSSGQRDASSHRWAVSRQEHYRQREGYSSEESLTEEYPSEGPRTHQKRRKVTLQKTRNPMFPR